MAKLPSFQFYPGDYYQDAISRETVEHKAFWLDCLMLAHSAEKRGYLQDQAQPIAIERISRYTGQSPDRCKALLDYMVQIRSFRVTQSGVYFVDWIAEQERKRKANNEDVKAHRRRKDVRSMKGECKVNVSPYSSSVSFSSSKTEPPIVPLPGDPPKVAKPPGECQLLVDHVFATYKAKYGVNPLFGGAHGKIVKTLLANFSLPQVKACWDLFLGQSWDWENNQGRTVKVPHTLMNFQKNLSVILEKGAWKRMAAEYERQEVPAESEVQALPPITLKEVPRAPQDRSGERKKEEADKLASLGTV